ncbi:hypothetical protein N431DRAFT_562011 [Stipitochalara longipes BDJ]|nr:hypothetical protein N431DRAFT_562011 [Stipitochalara longipes BDJ]
MSTHERQKLSHGNHKRRGHGHGHQHDGSKASGSVSELFWGCCYCGDHASMSIFIEQCPGCSHTRCGSCATETVEIRISQIVPPKSTSISSTSKVIQGNSQSGGFVPTGVARLDTPRPIIRNILSGTPVEISEVEVEEAGIQGNSSSSKRPRHGFDPMLERMQDKYVYGDFVECPSGFPGGLSGENHEDDNARDIYGCFLENLSTIIENPGDNKNIIEPLGSPPRLFACHFHKLDPRKYGPWTDIKYDKCSSSHITQLRHIKRHFKKAHTPLPYCKHCFRSFENTNQLKDHSQAPVTCKPSREFSHAVEGIEGDQWQEINRVLGQKGKHVDDDFRWYEIWRILFPGLAKPSSTRIERPGYIAHNIYGIDELRSEFAHRIEGDVQDGTIQRDGLQRILYQFEQTLEACSAALGLLRLDKPMEDRKGQEILSAATQANPSGLGNILFNYGDYAGYPSRIAQLTSVQRGFQNRTVEGSGVDHTQLISELPLSATSLVQGRGHSAGIDTALPGSALSQFCGYDFDSEAANFLRQSALPDVTPHVEEDWRGQWT